MRFGIKIPPLSVWGSIKWPANKSSVSWGRHLVFSINRSMVNWLQQCHPEGMMMVWWRTRNVIMRIYYDFLSQINSEIPLFHEFIFISSAEKCNNFCDSLSLLRITSDVQPHDMLVLLASAGEELRNWFMRRSNVNFVNLTVFINFIPQLIVVLVQEKEGGQTDRWKRGAYKIANISKHSINWQHIGGGNTLTADTGTCAR